MRRLGSDPVRWTSSRTGRAAGRADGFTLVEVVMALAIIALIAGLTLPRVMPGTSSTSLRIEAFRLAALLRQDRNAALSSGRSVSTAIDPAGAMVMSGDSRQILKLSPGVLVGMTADTANPLVFYPDGHASGGEIKLSRRGTSFTVRVEPVTATIDIVAR